jgi:hypothetical protein
MPLSRQRADLRFRGRRGMLASVSVLVALTVIMMLFAASVRIMLTARQALRGQQERMQVEYLTDAAVGRAAARRAADPKYTGETWQLDAETLGGQAATVEIRVHGDTGADVSRVEVAAEYPRGAERRVRMTREELIPIPVSRKLP